jgi:aldehyde dehydrogenase (NAD+)
MKNVHQRAEQLIKALQAKIPLLSIGGLNVESDGSATLQVCSPADGSLVGRVPGANELDVDRAVAAARSAFEGAWGETSPQERASVLWRAADLVEAEAQDLAVLEVLETGKTVREVVAHDLASTVSALRYYAGWVTKRGGMVHDLGGGMLGYALPEPHPVVGVITPWSAPLTAAAWKCAAALAAGSAVVVKPSELTPFTTFRLGDIFAKAGLPSGAFNVITGFGQPAGEALALHPGVDALAFSGSIETARRLQVASAKSNLKPVHLVLGGKSAAIVFDDAAVQKAVSAAWRAIFTARGTAPTGCSRLIVHESIYPEVVSMVTDRARQIVVGDPLDDHTELGPVVSEEHMKRILAYVELGRREGAKLVAGGTRDVEGIKAAGFYVKPTVFMDVRPEMRIAREAIPGPVLVVLPFKKEEEAIAIANGTDYGFATAVWTRDLGRAQRVAKKVRTGVVWINAYDLTDPALPYGGTHLSGHGRDLGRAGLEQFTTYKALYVPAK